MASCMLNRTSLILVLLFCCSMIDAVSRYSVLTSVGMAQEVIQISGFSSPLNEWVLAAGHAGQITQSESGVQLNPKDSSLALYSLPFTMGSEYPADAAYLLSFSVDVKHITAGYFAVTVECLDKAEQRTGLWVCYARNEKQSTEAQKTIRFNFGQGTGNSFPARTASMRIRISFSSPVNKIDASVALSTMNLSRQCISTVNQWPPEIFASIGDSTRVRFESRSFWTLYRVDFNGKRIGTDQFGSHYGAVAKFADIGFVGSGHTENGITELVESLDLLVDGKKIEPLVQTVDGTTVELRKRSHLRNLSLVTVVKVEHDSILQSVVVSAAKPEKLDLLYLFMLPWTVEMSDYMVGAKNGTVHVGKFDGSDDFPVIEPAVWVAEYSHKLKVGAVMILIESANGSNPVVKLWDTKERYKKFYLQTFSGQTISAGKEHLFTLKTVLFEAEQEDWQNVARTTIVRNGSAHSMPCTK